MAQIFAQDVIDEALELVEMENATGTSGFATTKRVQDRFNKGLSKLHYTLADSDLDWFGAQATITVTAGTPRYALPNGVLYDGAPQFYKMKELYIVESGKLYPVEKFQRAEVSGWSSAPPTVGATLRLLYVPAYLPIPNADSWADVEIATPYPPGWEDYVACFIAVRLAIRDEQYERAQALAAERDQAMIHVMQHCAPRDVGRPERVMDITGRWNTDVPFGLERSYAYRLFGDYLEIGQAAY